VVLDNKTVGKPLQHEISDIAVYIQRYSSEAEKYQNASLEAIRINQSYMPSGDLHDFLNETISRMLDDNQEN